MPGLDGSKSLLALSLLKCIQSGYRLFRDRSLWQIPYNWLGTGNANQVAALHHCPISEAPICPSFLSSFIWRLTFQSGLTPNWPPGLSEISLNSRLASWEGTFGCKAAQRWASRRIHFKCQRNSKTWTKKKLCWYDKLNAKCKQQYSPLNGVESRKPKVGQLIKCQRKCVFACVRVLLMTR